MGWSDPADWPVGYVPTNAFLNAQIRDNLLYLRSGGYSIYAQITSLVTVTSYAEATPNTVVTSGAQTYTADPILITFFATLIGTGTQNMVLSLWDSTTNLGQLAEIKSGGDNPVYAARRLTPTAGSHTYLVRAWNRASTTGYVYAGAGSGAGVVMPAFIRISGG